MRRIKKFRYGGLYQRGQAFVGGQSIENAYLPNHALLIFREHEAAGEPDLAVNEGQLVAEGQLLAKATRNNALNVHASIPGVVRKIMTIPSPEGFNTRALVLSMQGHFKINGAVSGKRPWHSLNRHELAFVLQEKGVACTATGLGLHQILANAHGVDTLIINAIDSTKYPAHEIVILEEYLDEVIEGCAIIKKASTVQSLIFALSGSRNQKLELSIAKTAEKFDLQYRIEYFSDKYPQAFPHQIISALGGNKGNKPHLFLVPGTLYAVYNAVSLNRPHIDQFVTFGGDVLKHHQLLKVRIGTPIGRLIEECGGFIQAPEILALNNPMVNGCISNLDTPVSKTTRAVWALSKSATRLGIPDNCIRCGACIQVCPERLDPYVMHKLLGSGNIDKVRGQLDACTSCGACSYVCRSRIPLSVEFRNKKKEKLKDEQ